MNKYSYEHQSIKDRCFSYAILLDALNHENFKKKDYSRYDQWTEERHKLLPLPSVHYEYMERRTAKVFGDFHIRFDNAYYSVDKAYLHKSVMVPVSTSVSVSISFSIR